MISGILVAITLIAILFMGFIALKNNFRSPTNISFFLLTFFLVLWAIANYLENENISFDLRSLFLRLDFFLGLFVAYFWLLFSLIFLEDEKSLLGYVKKNVIIIVPIIIFLPLVLGDLVINNINLSDLGINFNFGLLFIPYAMIIVGYLVGGLYILLRKYRKFKGLKKIQVLYVMIGLLISAIITLIINLVLQNFVSVEIARFGIYGFVFIIGFTTYAIVKHHLMNIKVVAAEISSILLVIISLIEVFIFNSFFEFLVKLIIFISSLLISILLINSVLNEVKRREQMEELNSQLKEASKKLSAANRELKRLDDAKSEFLSIASHQLRTPITVIKGYVSMVIDGSYGRISPTIKKVLKDVYTSNERLLALVENLLDISRIEAGRLEFDLKSVDLTENVRRLVKDFQQKAKEKGLKLEFYESEKVPKVIADEKKIDEVISNIIDNAIKYTPKGEITVGLHQEGTSVVFTSQDTGLGIHPEDLPRLFNKFVRGQGMMQVHTEGTGLGLYYARVVIENMGGRIWVESAGKNKGSKFSFSLPLADKKLAKKVKNT